MNPIGKKLISLFLVFSLIMLSVNLYAKERRGAHLIVTKKNGQLIEGELISVKKDSLLLLDTEGKDVSVDIADTRTIWIVKKSKIGEGALIGLLVCGGGGVLIGLTSEYAYMPLVWGLLGGLIGVVIGALSGVSAGRDKKIQIEGISKLKIKKILQKLRKKARVRDYK